ncbi:MAG: 5,6-dimethylbenzimidazole synthase [Rubrobacter sp.]|nr:5,6-dimethylbenzimidazole synthase [Rubrobacter sp.]
MANGNAEPERKQDGSGGSEGSAASGFSDPGFSEMAQDAVYAAIYGRRDVRSFLPGEIPEDVLRRILQAANQAPSVGLSQPWEFILIRSTKTRREVKRLHDDEKLRQSKRFEDDERRQAYLDTRLEGILDAPVNVCVTCDRSGDGEPVLGKDSVPDTDLYSVCLAVQNLWLAARAEGVGACWVSVIRNPELKEILSIPEGVLPVAYLCLGYPADGFPERPLLETAGWREQRPLKNMVRMESW